MESWWRELDDEVLGCLARGACSPGDVARRLGMSESAATSVLSMLISEGKVRVRLVELTESSRNRPDVVRPPEGVAA